MILIAVDSQPAVGAAVSFLAFFSISADWRETGNDSERKPNFRSSPSSHYNINKKIQFQIKFTRHIFLCFVLEFDNVTCAFTRFQLSPKNFYSFTKKVIVKNSSSGEKPPWPVVRAQSVLAWNKRQ